MIDEQLIHKKISNTLYVHDCFSSMFHGMLDWIQTQFEPRFAYKVISTYDKAVQFFKSKKMAKDGTIQTNILPSVTLDPNLDFTNEERSGKFLWMFPNLDSLSRRTFAKKIYLQDQGVTISVMHTRYGGTCDITFWLSSIYELIDFRTKIIQYCGGIGRWIRPKFFWSHMILPKDIVEFNRPTDSKKLDWSATPLEIIQLTTTNSREYAIPYPINAIWRLDSLSDGSTKYGADQLTEWRFTATFTWEANIPTYLRLDNYSFHNMRPSLNIHVSPTYSSQPLINRIPMIRSLTQDQIIAEVIKTNKLYMVDNKEIITNTETNQNEEVTLSPFVKFDDTQCHHYPQSYVEWDHISSGILIDNEYIEEHDGEIPKERYILLIDKYDPELHDDYLRSSRGCLCCNDDISSEFYTKISSLRLSTICHFDKKLYKALKKQIGNEFTFDSVSRLIYTGIHGSKFLGYSDVIDKNCYDVCNNVIDIIKKQSSSKFNDPEYKKLSFGEMTIVNYDKKESLGRLKKDQKSIEVPYLISSELAKNIRIYINDNYAPKDWYEALGKIITFNEKAQLSEYAKIDIEYIGLTKTIMLELMTNYIMTKSDEKDYLVKGKRITIDIPEEFDTDYIECCSYNGQLDRNVDFEINDRTITFKLEPMRDKVIQVFANRNYN